MNLHRRYGHSQLTAADYVALRFLSGQPGGMGARDGRHQLTYPRARKLERLGLVTVKAYAVSGYGRRPFGEPGPGKLHHELDWMATITAEGRTVAGSHDG